jgi:hypothetical protein
VTRLWCILCRSDRRVAVLIPAGMTWQEAFAEHYKQHAKPMTIEEVQALGAMP